MSSSNNAQVTETGELDKYLSHLRHAEDDNPLVYWNLHQTSLPTLSKLVQRYLSIPGSSAPIERLFSITGKLFRPDRCSMSAKVFKKLKMIKCN